MRVKLYSLKFSENLERENLEKYLKKTIKKRGNFKNFRKN
jgi:hypothetical protein